MPITEVRPAPGTKPRFRLPRGAVPAALILPTFLGVEGVLWTGPVADGLAFLLSLALLLYERHHLKKGHARQLSAGQCETA